MNEKRKQCKSKHVVLSSGVVICISVVLPFSRNTVFIGNGVCGFCNVILRDVLSSAIQGSLHTSSFRAVQRRHCFATQHLSTLYVVVRAYTAFTFNVSSSTQNQWRRQELLSRSRWVWIPLVFHIRERNTYQNTVQYSAKSRYKILVLRFLFP